VSDKRKVGSIGDLGQKQGERLNVEVTVQEKKIEGGGEANRRVKSAGDLLAPDGYERLNSYAVHVYKHPFSLDLQYVTQVLTSDSKIELKPIEANIALKRLSEKVAAAFGWEPNKHQRSKIKGF
jgi:hypothetical protein